MNVVEALKNLTRLSGEVVTIEGIFVGRAPEFYLYIAADEDLIDDFSQSIRIVMPYSLDDLRQNLIPRVGSPYLYSDPATVTGSLRSSNDGIFPAIITDLERLIVDQEGDVTDVPLGP